MDNLQERVIKEIGEELGWHHTADKEIKEGDDLVEDLGADSMDIVELTIALEEEFDIEISDELASEWKTVENIISTVRLLTADKEA